jgi:hypothetical protein
VVRERLSPESERRITMQTHENRAAGLVPVALLILAACGLGCGDDNVIGPQFQPEIINQADSFEFQATGVTDVTQTLNYSWTHTGVAANVDQSCSITQGAASVRIWDDAGTLVYDRSLTDGGTFSTLDGVAGTWTLRVILSQVDGTLNFRAQKKT